MTSWAMASRAGNGRRTDRSQSLVRLSEDIGRGGGGRGVRGGGCRRAASQITIPSLPTQRTPLSSWWRSYVYYVTTP